MRKPKKTRKVDKRRVPRSHLVFYLRVFDATGTKIVGHLVDISRRGMMLVCDTPFEKSQVLTLRMKLPKEQAGRHELIVEGTCRWCRQDKNPDFYIAGFKFEAIPSDLVEHVRQLTSDFSIEESLQDTESEPPACSLTHTTGHMV